MAPERFGRYEVVRLLGRGGMGAVHLARDPNIDRLVAVKTLASAVLEDPGQRAEFLERFRREARAAGRLSHPHVVAVYDMGEDPASGTPYLVMEYVPGVSLATLLRENPRMPVDQGVELLEQAASALAEAHRVGIVHRDVKPANVMVDQRGQARVADFGIARLPDSRLTQTGVGLGTPGFVAPEVLQGEPATARADVFALGAMAYQVLGGERPFPGDTRETLAVSVLAREPRPLRELRPELPEPLARAVMAALAKDPAARTPSAERFGAELRAGLREAPVEPTRTAVPPTQEAPVLPAPLEPPPPGRRGPLLVVAGLLVLAALGAGFLLFLLRDRLFRAPTARPAGTSVPHAGQGPTPTPPAARGTPAPATSRSAPTPGPTARPTARPTPLPQVETAEPQEKAHDRGGGKGHGKGRSHGKGKGKKGKGGKD